MRRFLLRSRGGGQTFAAKAGDKEVEYNARLPEQGLLFRGAAAAVQALPGMVPERPGAD